MNVVLDVDPISPPLTGIGRYTLELARGLRGDSRVGELRFFCRGRLIEDPERLLEEGSAAAAIRRSVPFRSLARTIYRKLNGWRFGSQMASLPKSVYHSPNYTLMPYNGPSVVTVHDLSIVRHPQFHPRERVEFLRRELPKALTQAACVLTDSDFVRHELAEIYGVPLARSRTVYLGVDSSFGPVGVAESAPVLERLGLRHASYLLSVATVEPRKNLFRLIRAFAALPTSTRQAFPLVLAGARGWGDTSLRAEIEPLLLAGEAVVLGYVQQSDLPSLYSGAAAFVYPSLYEGFGLPALEAMACGAPVITSGTTSLPEVVGSAARLVDPLSIESIREAIAALLSDEEARATLTRLGLAQASRFSWARCVEQTVDVYSSVA